MCAFLIIRSMYSLIRGYIDENKFKFWIFMLLYQLINAVGLVGVNWCGLYIYMFFRSLDNVYI
jgi:hypothetical protein